MRPWSRVGMLASLAACALAAVSWLLTGREAFTRWPNERLERADRATSPAEQDLLDELGVGSTADAPPTIESRFAFGLLPGGLDPLHAVSVATVCAVAAASAIAIHLVSRATARPPQE